MKEQEKSEVYHGIRKEIVEKFNKGKTKKEIALFLMRRYKDMKTDLQRRIFFVAVMTVCIERAGDLFEQKTIEQAGGFFDRLGFKFTKK